MNKIRTVTFWDALIIILLLGASFGAIPVLNTYKPATVVIYRDNRPIAEYPLSENRKLTVEGHEGKMVVTIKNGKASIESSSCAKQVCVKSGEIALPFQQLICAPNHILVEIKAGKAGEGLDAVAR